MKKFQTLSSRAVLLMCAVWAVLTFGGMLTNGQSYFFLGLISAWLGVQNIILLNMGQKTGEMPDKLAYHVKQKGERGGIIRYVIINILLYLLIGIVVMVCGWSMMFPAAESRSRNINCLTNTKKDLLYEDPFFISNKFFLVIQRMNWCRDTAAAFYK